MFELVLYGAEEVSLPLLLARSCWWNGFNTAV